MKEKLNICKTDLVPESTGIEKVTSGVRRRLNANSVNSHSCWQIIFQSNGWCDFTHLSTVFIEIYIVRMHASST